MKLGLMIVFVSSIVVAPFALADEPRLLHAALYGDETDVPVDFRGWVSSGFTFNTDSPDGNFNGPLSFNDRANEIQLNQFGFVAERSVSADVDEVQLGGRVDFLFGTDAAFTQAIGLDDRWSSDRFYRSALPQFYAELFLPWLEGVRLKAGHFYTPIGYEVVTSPDNFFYSHAFTMQYGEPFTHTGALLSVSPSETLSFSLGAVRGWDNFEDQTDGNLSPMLGLTYTLDDQTSVLATLITGNEGESANRTMYSLVVTHQFSDDLSYVLQHDLGVQENGSASGGNAQWYGLNQYLIQKVTDSLSMAARLEWFRDDDATRVAGLRSGSPLATASYFGASFGANYSPCPYIKIRPEIRWDLQARGDSDQASAFDNGESLHQVTLASDVIFAF